MIGVLLGIRGMNDYAEYLKLLETIERISMRNSPDHIAVIEWYKSSNLLKLLWTMNEKE